LFQAYGRSIARARALSTSTVALNSTGTPRSEYIFKRRISTHRLVEQTTSRGGIKSIVVYQRSTKYNLLNIVSPSFILIFLNLHIGCDTTRKSKCLRLIRKCAGKRLHHPLTRGRFLDCGVDVEVQKSLDSTSISALSSSSFSSPFLLRSSSGPHSEADVIRRLRDFLFLQFDVLKYTVAPLSIRDSQADDIPKGG